MRPDVAHLWPRPRWALSLLLAGLSMVGPFSIDTYLPAFAGIAQSLDASPVQMQQTLSGYLFGFALMNLFHGALSDSLGRRPVVLCGLLSFTLASVGCAMADTVGALVFWRVVQGMSAGAGVVVSRAVIRDLYAPEDAQRVMSNVTLFFGVAPAVAPLVGGWLLIVVHWRAIFWFLAGVGAVLMFAHQRWLPESLPAERRQRFSGADLLRGYRQLGGDRRFMMLSLASGIPFNGMFLYVLSAPAFLGQYLAWPPERFFLFFCMVIAGIMTGAWLSGRLAGRVTAHQQVRYGFVLMGVMGLGNVILNVLTEPQAPWALLPIPLFAMGWAMLVPAVTLMVLDLVPQRRGMASSLQASLASAVNGLVAGILAPWVMHSPLGLAAASFALMVAGGVAWWWIQPRLGCSLPPPG